jgi:protease-4
MKIVVVSMGGVAASGGYLISMASDEVDKIARGRVWSGEDAHELGLVDSMGDLEDAIASSAELAELDNNYAVTYIEKDLAFKDKIAKMLLSRALEIVGPDALAVERNPATELLRQAQRELTKLTELNDPSHTDGLSMIEAD